jgi:hypothetical protein
MTIFLQPGTGMDYTQENTSNIAAQGAYLEGESSFYVFTMTLPRTL